MPTLTVTPGSFSNFILLIIFSAKSAAHSACKGLISGAPLTACNMACNKSIHTIFPIFHSVQ